MNVLLAVSVGTYKALISSIIYRRKTKANKVGGIHTIGIVVNRAGTGMLYSKYWSIFHIEMNYIFSGIPTDSRQSLPEKNLKYAHAQLNCS